MELKICNYMQPIIITLWLTYLSTHLFIYLTASAFTTVCHLLNEKSLNFQHCTTTDSLDRTLAPTCVVVEAAESELWNLTGRTPHITWEHLKWCDVCARMWCARTMPRILCKLQPVDSRFTYKSDQVVSQTKIKQSDNTDCHICVIWLGVKVLKRAQKP